MLRRLTPRDWVELFVILNLGFLAVDIYLAHCVNQFACWQEWVPLGFSLAAPLILLAALALGGFAPVPGVARFLGLAVGWAAVVVGVAGLLLHLQSQFFAQQTLRSLVYAAPFVAPLAYAGLGLLLILGRMVDGASRQWAHWTILLALGGFIGNFVLSLADHAANGFFHWTEWIPVIAAAFAIGFLLAVLMIQTGQGFIRACLWLLAVEVLVGLLGFCLHLVADLHGTVSTLADNFIYGAPVFAPLLFVNLAILAAIGLWALERCDLPATRS